MLPVFQLFSAREAAAERPPVFAAASLAVLVVAPGLLALPECLEGQPAIPALWPLRRRHLLALHHHILLQRFQCFEMNLDARRSRQQAARVSLRR